MSDTDVNRRSIFLGGGAAFAAGAFVYGAGPADATPTPHSDGTSPRGVHPMTSPVTTTIASAPVSGWTYRTVCMYDFTPFQTTGQRAWGGSGTYSANSGGPMRATIEIPAGALVRDVEYYVSNTSTNIVYGDAYIYVPGFGTITSVNATVVVPAQNGGITAYRVRTTSTTWGPYPIGTRLLVGVSTPADGSVQINGARVGFSSGAGTTGLLSAPIRAYDSRSSGGKFAANSTRTITLPSSVVTPGVTGAILNVTAVNGTSDGYLKVFSAASGEPAASAINYSHTGAAIANGMTVAVSSVRQIKIKASAPVHVIVDVTGVVA